MKNLIALFLLFLATFTEPQAKISPSLVTHVKDCIVLIDAAGELGAYRVPSSWSGSGFIVDAERGIIATNAHIAPSGVSARYRLTFQGGEKIDANFLYADPWQDFAFLKVDPKELPQTARPLPFTSRPLEMDEKVLVCGNNERNPFSVQTGIVTDLYIYGGHFPNRSIQMSLNTAGGSSGSPIVSEREGAVVALNYGSSESAAFVLPIGYIHDALKSLQKGSLPARYHPGMLSVLYALDDSVKFGNFPPKLMHDYRAEFPEARSRIPIILSIMPGSPAEGVLQEGDVIWSVGGQKIGPDIYEMDKIFNQNGPKPVELVIVRDGALKTVTLTPENLEPRRINRIVSFAGTYFYEPDDYVRKNFDVSAPTNKPGLFLSWAQPSSPFNTLFTSVPFNDKVHNYIEIMTLDGKPVHDLDTLLAMIPDLMTKKNFFVTYVNHFTGLTFNNEPLPTRRKMIDAIEYTDAQAPPYIAFYDPDTLKWQVQEMMPEPMVVIPQEGPGKTPPVPEATLLPAR